MYTVWLNDYLIDKISGWCVSQSKNISDQDMVYTRYYPDETDVTALESIYPFSKENLDFATMLFGVDTIKVFEDNYLAIKKLRDGLPRS